MFVDGFVFYYSEENRRPVRVKQFVTFFSRTLPDLNDSNYNNDVVI